MSIWAIYEPTGKITAVIMGDLAAAEMNAREGQSIAEVGYQCDPSTHYFNNGSVVEYPSRPSDYVQFDFATHQWVPDDASAFFALREERNRRLAASDWTQVADAPVDAAAWAAYRQALRDMPGNTLDPRNPVWPTLP